MLANEALGGGEGLLDGGARRDIVHVPFDLARLHLGEIEDVVEEPSQALAFLHDDLEKLAALSDRQIRVVVNDFAEGADRGERCPELMADRRHEVVLELVELL
jgi:hypothetical protein